MGGWGAARAWGAGRSVCLAALLSAQAALLLKADSTKQQPFGGHVRIENMEPARAPTDKGRKKVPALGWGSSPSPLKTVSEHSQQQ